MAGLKKQYYIKGVGKQGRADITLEIKRISIDNINRLPDEDRQKIKIFIEDFKIQLSQLIHSIH